MTESRRLGRGLEALLGPLTREEAQTGGGLKELAVTAISPNPFQPRREFAEAQLQELADSIAASGLLQPVLVRPRPEGRYELIAGERRWRAVQRLGWERIPAVVKEADDRSLLTLALIENLQRDDLSPIDAAQGYQQLMQEFSLPQQEVARLVGKDRSTVSNTLRLLRLPAEVQRMVGKRALTEGHARALLALSDPREITRLAHECAAAEWSVRDLEARIRGEQLQGTAPARRLIRRPKPEVRHPSADIRRVEDALRKRLQTDVRVTARRRGRGAVTIHYYSNDDLARLLELVLGEPFGQMSAKRGVSVIVQRDGALQSRSYRVSLWVLRALFIAAVALTVILVLGLAFYGPVARQAARVPGLTREVERLRIDNQRIRELAAALDSVESNYERLRGMVGADIAPDRVGLGSALPVAPAIYAAPPSGALQYETEASPPRHWPLDERGYVTRGQAPAASGDEAHPGIDIAVPVGSVVRASGGGVVLQTGAHVEYGNFVLLEHPEGYQSMYGHLSRILAVQGMRVRAGEVVALSGNTGRSSAPHLHFEIRLNGLSIDPGTLVKEER